MKPASPPRATVALTILEAKAAAELIEQYKVLQRRLGEALRLTELETKALLRVSAYGDVRSAAEKRSLTNAVKKLYDSLAVLASRTEKSNA